MENDLKLRTAIAAAVTTADGDLETNMAEAEEVLTDDNLFHALVVQRSRAYVAQEPGAAGRPRPSSPNRDDPQVAEYSVKKTYGKLLEMVEEAFAKEKPLFSLAIYYPLAYYKVRTRRSIRWLEEPPEAGRRPDPHQFLKRFESSARAFECPATRCC